MEKTQILITALTNIASMKNSGNPDLEGKILRGLAAGALVDYDIAKSKESSQPSVEVDAEKVAKHPI